MKDKSIFIATPIRGMVEPKYVLAMVDILTRPICKLFVRFWVDGGTLQMGRNWLAKEFLKTNATHILWWDSDIVPNADILYTLTQNADKDIVGGCYLHKTEKNITWCMKGFKEEKVDPNTLYEVASIGFGFTLMRREVFEKMKDTVVHFTDKTVQADDCWEFFRMGANPKTKEYDTEDWEFCDKARALGFHVYADMRLVVPHVGKIEFPTMWQEYVLKRQTMMEQGINEGDLQIINQGNNNEKEHLRLLQEK